MKIPNLKCQIDAYCVINSTEDPAKVKQAISNILPESKIQISKNSLKATSQNLDTLSNIFRATHSRKTQGVYRRFLNNNLYDYSTWFYLNKQAALSNIIALCDEADESPLGPIKIVLTSNNIDQIIEWLVSEG
ncbi:MAG TPA: RNA-binding domain-containing protein [Nitrosopumilaceae archaeon]|nr:RNA-binding domain-containing protein [Nitrosopumilaceae archaeon]